MPRGSLNTKNAQPAPTLGASRLVTGTVEQEAIWAELLTGTRHVIVEAVAGSGKTFTITQYAMRDKERRIGLVAFNKHIATELTERMGGQSNVECMTYHSLGFKTVKRSVRHAIRVDQYKVLSMLDDLSLPVSEREEKTAKYRISSMVSYAKTYGHGPMVSRDELEWIADRHDLDLNGLAEVVMDYTSKILSKCMKELRTIDFDDMVWLPHQMGWDVPKYDVLCVDEYQDTSLTQQWMAVKGGTRVVAVGDSRQAIYSFRGCDGKGFDNLRRELGEKNVVTLPLSMTRRCPKSHVRLAQMIVPQIQALPDAPEGVVRTTPDLESAVGEMRPGDLVVCRVNAELVGTAYRLLKRGVKAVVRGRDIGQGLIKLLEKGERRVGRSPLSECLRACGELTGEDCAKFLKMPNGRGESRAQAAQDKYDCLMELAEGQKTFETLKGVIESLFADFETDGQPKHAVVLGTVHRTKGLEGERVFVLRPDLIPHPMAKKPEDVEAEYNLAYVAVTRAKFSKGRGQGELVFVGRECSLFPISPAQQPQGTLFEMKTTLTTPKWRETPINEDEMREAEYQVEEELDGGGIPEWSIDEDGIITREVK